jgi:hypothetical protein
MRRRARRPTSWSADGDAKGRSAGRRRFARTRWRRRAASVDESSGARDAVTHEGMSGSAPSGVVPAIGGGFAAGGGDAEWAKRPESG